MATICIIANSASGHFLNPGISGGDKILIECARRWSEWDHCVHINVWEGGYYMCVQNGLHDVSYTINRLARYRRAGGLVMALLKIFIGMLRSVTAPVTIKGDALVIYSASDSWPDILPALIMKRRFARSKLLAPVFHLIPPPCKRTGNTLINLLKYIEQQISLKLIARSADAVVIDTSIIKDELVYKLGFKREKIHVISGGFDSKMIDKVIVIAEKKYDACFVGRIQPTKGISDLIDAWYVVCRHKKDSKLALVGFTEDYPAYVQKMKKKIKRLGLDSNIIMFGFVPEHDKYSILCASRLFVSASYEEGTPVSFHEALYCGLPIVAYNLPTYKDLGDAVIRAKLGDPKNLADKIITVLDTEESMHAFKKRRGVSMSHEWGSVALSYLKALSISLPDT